MTIDIKISDKRFVDLFHVRQSEPIKHIALSPSWQNELSAETRVFLKENPGFFGIAIRFSAHIPADKVICVGASGSVWIVDVETVDFIGGENDNNSP